jgi:hypothetical protein
VCTTGRPLPDGFFIIERLRFSFRLSSTFMAYCRGGAPPPPLLLLLLLLLLLPPQHELVLRVDLAVVVLVLLDLGGHRYRTIDARPSFSGRARRRGRRRHKIQFGPTPFFLLSCEGVET